MTHEPLLKSSRLTIYLVIPPLHAWINSLGMFETIAYLLNAKHAFPNGIFRGRGQSAEQKKAIQNAKERVKDLAKNGPLNLPIDQPDPSGCGGSTDTGIHVCIAFYSTAFYFVSKALKFKNYFFFVYL